MAVILREYEKNKLKENKKFLEKNDFEGLFKSLTSSRFGSGNIAAFLMEMASVPILEYMTRIPDYTFEDCPEMESLTIPGNVIEIGKNAFDHSRIKHIEMADSVVKMGANCFAYSQLESIKLSNKLTILPRNTFEDCSNLKEVILPDSIIKIGAGAFYNCPDDLVIKATYRENAANKIVAAKSDYDFLKAHWQWIR